MSEWPRNWAELTRGVGCEMCESGRPDTNRYGVRILAGRYTDAYLQRADVQRGYTLVIWHGRHVNEPTELDDAEASGYWARAPARSLSLWADSCSCWSWGRTGRVCWMAVAGGGGDVTVRSRRGCRLVAERAW